MILLDKSQLKAKESELHFMIRDLKSLARELNIMIIAVSQMEAPSVDNWDIISEYSRHWINQCDDDYACSQQSDIFLLLLNPSYYDLYEDAKGNDVRNMMIVYIKKNRNGKTGQVCLRYDQLTGSIRDLYEPEPYEERDIEDSIIAPENVDRKVELIPF